MTRRSALWNRPLSAAGAELSLWKGCAIALDALAPSLDVIAVTPVGSYLAWQLRRAVDAKRLFLHSPEPDPERMRHPGEVTPVVLPGGLERDRVILARGLWPWPPETVAARVRPLDLLYADSHTVGLLILDAGDRTVEILRGAARVLSEHAPQVLINFGCVSIFRQSGLWNTCAAVAAYEWRVCGGAIVYGINVGKSVTGRVPGMSQARVRRRLPRLRTAALPGLRLEFDDTLPTIGMYGAEPDGNGGWRRRTGPRPPAAFYLPLPASGRWQLRLQIAHWGEMQSTAELRFYAGGIRLRQECTSADMIKFAPFEVPAHHRGRLLVELTSPIGVALGHCIVEPVAS